MLGREFDDIERSGSGCSFGCRCSACLYDSRLDDKPRYSKYKSDEQYGYTYKPSNKRGK